MVFPVECAECGGGGGGGWGGGVVCGILKEGLVRGCGG